MFPGTPTLDQLTVFVAVAEKGSFAAAARKLGRATSAISYSISNLELQLGLALFDRARTRRPVLTNAGATVLAEAQAVSTSIQELRSKVTSILGGLEAEVSLAIDALFPGTRLTDVLAAFKERFPDVRLRLEIQALGAVPQLVLDGKAALGVSGPVAENLAELHHISLGNVELVPVAAPNHPLASQMQPSAVGGKDHLQLVLSDRSNQ